MNLSFIKLDINIMNDSKIKLLRKMPEGSKLFELWIGMMCLGMKSGRAGVLEIGDGIPFTDEMLSNELDIPITVTRMGLETFHKLKMIEVFDDEAIYLVNFEKHQALDKIEIGREKARERQQKHREKAKTLKIEDKNPVTRDITLSSRDVTRQIKIKTKTKNKISKNDENSSEKLLEPSGSVSKKTSLPKEKKTSEQGEALFQRVAKIRKTEKTIPIPAGERTGFYVNERLWVDEILKDFKPHQIGLVLDYVTSDDISDFWKDRPISFKHWTSYLTEYRKSRQD